MFRALQTRLTRMRNVRSICCKTRVLNAVSTNNYFEMFQLPEEYDLNPQHLHEQYKRLQFKFHPDRNRTVAAPELSTNINVAYHILKHPVSRAQYMLRDVPAQDVPLDEPFLERMLDIQQQLDEQQAIPQQVHEQLTTEYHQLIQSISRSIEAKEFVRAIKSTKKLAFIDKLISR